MADTNEVSDIAIVALAGLTAVTASIVFVVKLSQMLGKKAEEPVL